MSSSVPNKNSAESITQKKWFPFAALATLLLLAGLVLWFFFGQKSPNPQPTNTNSSVVSGPTKVSSASNGTQSSPSSSSSEPSSAAPSSAYSSSPAQVSPEKQAANNFLKSLKQGKSGTEWADSMKSMSTSSLYETFKVASPNSIPDGATKAVIQSDASPWTVSATDDHGTEKFTFKLNKVDTKNGTAYLVSSIDVPDQAPKKDSNGNFIPAPIAPLSSSSIQSLKQQSFSILKLYFEYQGNAKTEDREAKLKHALNGGSYPPLRPNLGMEPNVQLYAPNNVHMLDSNVGDPTVNDQISVAQTVSYANVSASNYPIETLNCVVDFKWNPEGNIWAPTSMRILS